MKTLNLISNVTIVLVVVAYIYTIGCALKPMAELKTNITKIVGE